MFRRHSRTWSFHVVLQRTAKKCTKICNARARLLFCSLNLLFGDVLVAVVVVVCLSSLFSQSILQVYIRPERTSRFACDVACRKTRFQHFRCLCLVLQVLVVKSADNTVLVYFVDSYPLNRQMSVDNVIPFEQPGRGVQHVRGVQRVLSFR